RRQWHAAGGAGRGVDRRDRACRRRCTPHGPRSRGHSRNSCVGGSARRYAGALATCLPAHGQAGQTVPVRFNSMLEQSAVFLAGFLTAITGFGFNAVSLPLLAVAFEPHHAVVVGLLVGLLIFALVLLLPGVRHAVDRRLVWTLFAWSLLGLPVGARILVLLDDRALRLVIGGLTFAYAAGQLAGLL